MEKEIAIYVDGSAINNENPNTPTLGGIGVATFIHNVYENRKMEMLQKREGVHHYWSVRNHKVIDKVHNQLSYGAREAPFEIDLGKTTNNTTELAAIYGALQMMKLTDMKGWKIVIYGDSQYAGNLIFGNWKAKENKDLVRKIRSLADDMKRDYDIRWEYVKAHAGDDYNNYADYLARSAAYNVDTAEILTFNDWSRKNQIAA
jgi:ribonuclease HI